MKGKREREKETRRIKKFRENESQSCRILAACNFVPASRFENYLGARRVYNLSFFPLDFPLPPSLPSFFFSAFRFRFVRRLFALSLFVDKQRRGAPPPSRLAFFFLALFSLRPGCTCANEGLSAVIRACNYSFLFSFTAFLPAEQRTYGNI